MTQLRFSHWFWFFFFEFKISNFSIFLRRGASGWNVYRAADPTTSRCRALIPPQFIFPRDAATAKKPKKQPTDCQWQRWENVSVRVSASSAAGVTRCCSCHSQILGGALCVPPRLTNCVWLQAAKLFGDQCLLSHELGGFTDGWLPQLHFGDAVQTLRSDSTTPCQNSDSGLTLRFYRFALRFLKSFRRPQHFITKHGQWSLALHRGSPHCGFAVLQILHAFFLERATWTLIGFTRELLAIMCQTL